MVISFNVPAVLLPRLNGANGKYTMFYCGVTWSVEQHTTHKNSSRFYAAAELTSTEAKAMQEKLRMYNITAFI